MPAILVLVCLLACPAMADVLVPVRTIRAQTIVSATDFRIQNVDMPGAFPVTNNVDGLEARVALYAGRPVLANDLGPPALVGRNDIVTLVFLRGGLRIATEGRALARGGVGDTIRVMNLSSRTTIFGQVLETGEVEVK